MHNPVVDKITCFDGSIDPSLHGIQAWRSTVQVITDATRTYPERLSKAVQILRDFISRGDESSNPNFKTSMEFMMNVLIQVTDFHIKLWCHCVDGLTFRSSEPSTDLLRKYKDIWDEHTSLEKLANDSKLYYQKCLKKWVNIHEEVSEVLTAEWLSYDGLYATVTSKVDVALTKYQSYFRKEAKHRKILLKQIDELRLDFIDNEEIKIDEIFNTLKELLRKMKNVAPNSIRGLEELCREVDVMNTREMAIAGWAACEKTHRFPKYEGPKGTDPMGPFQPILEVNGLKKGPCPTKLFSIFGKSDTSTGTSDSIDEYYHVESYKKKALKEYALSRAKAHENSPRVRFLPGSMSPSADSKTPNKADKTGDTKDTKSRAESKGLSSKSPFHFDRNVKKLKSSGSTSNTSAVEDLRNSHHHDINREVPKKQQTSMENSCDNMTHTEGKGKGTHQKKGDISQTCVKTPSVAWDQSCKMKTLEKKSLKESERLVKMAAKADSTVNNVSTLSGVVVIALKDRRKQSSKEISIRAGMKIKQTKEANKDGMAYGYKRVKLGIKKYGFYPANLVSLYSKN